MNKEENESNADYYMPLTISLYPRPHTQPNNFLFPAYHTVIKPFLDDATAAYVYNGSKNAKNPVKLQELPFLIPEKGKYRFDLTKNCVDGYEAFWNAATWRRGSIVILLPADFNFDVILPHCFYPVYDGTPNSGNSVSAVKLCKAAVKDNSRAVIFWASNGIELCNIYGSIEQTKTLYTKAQALCTKR